MALSTILDAIETALKTPTNVGGAATVKQPMPETPPTGSSLPFVGIDLLPGTIQPSNLSIWTYPVDIYFLQTERTGDVAADLSATVLDMPKAIVDRLNANATLNGKVYGASYREPGFEVGIVSWRDKTYVGCVVHALFKEKFATAYSG